MDKRYQVFISSTYEDLKHERDAVIKAVLEMGHFPVGMEMFNAADEEQWATIQREIDRSDYYLLIVAHRYGSTIAAEGGISYTEKEFDYAVSTGVPRIGFVIDKGVSWEPTFVDQGKQKKRLDQFKTKVKGRPVDFWKSRDDLATKVVLSLGKLIALTDRPGWQRGNEKTQEVNTALAKMTEEFIKISHENEKLKLAARPNPQLKFYFIDKDGKSLGTTLYSNTADMNARTNKMRQTVKEITLLIEDLKNQETQDADSIENLIGSEPVEIPQDRIDSVTMKLHVLGIDGTPNFTFKDLYSLRSSATSYHKEAMVGKDYKAYKIFSQIENKLRYIDSDAKEFELRTNSVEYYIQCENIGAVSAEEVQFTIKGTMELYPSEGSLEYPPLEVIKAGYSGSIDKIIPHDQIEIQKFFVEKPKNPGEITLAIRAIGNNLAEPQINDLKIIFSENPSR